MAEKVDDKVWLLSKDIQSVKQMYIKPRERETNENINPKETINNVIT